jgi:hypothetical protein
MIDIKNTVDNHFKVHRNASLIDVLIEFDQFLDDLNVYSYKNWFEGEVIDGPHLSRYWCEISLMYPYEQMPDPEGGKRLLSRNCKVYYREDHYMEPRKVESPDDYEPGTKKPKIDKVPVWVVQIKVPKKYVLVYDSKEHDEEELEKGYQQGLDDATRQSGNETEQDI